MMNYDCMMCWIRPDGGMITLGLLSPEDSLDLIKQGYVPTDDRFFCLKEWNLPSAAPTSPLYRVTRLKASNYASLIKHGRLNGFKPRGAWQAVSRVESNDNNDKVVRVYASYLGYQSRPDLVIGYSDV